MNDVDDAFHCGFANGRGDGSMSSTPCFSGQSVCTSLAMMRATFSSYCWTTSSTSLFGFKHRQTGNPHQHRGSVLLFRLALSLQSGSFLRRESTREPVQTLVEPVASGGTAPRINHCGCLNPCSSTSLWHQLLSLHQASPACWQNENQRHVD